MNKRIDKPEFEKQLSEIQKKGLPYHYVPILKAQNPSLNSAKIRNVKNNKIINWDILKMLGNLVDYEVKTPNL